MCFVMDSCLVAEGDTADGVSVILVTTVWWIYIVWGNTQIISIITIVDRGPVSASETRIERVSVWNDPAAPDKHQRRLHNSIRISWGLGDEVGEATVCSGVAGGEGELSYVVYG